MVGRVDDLGLLGAVGVVRPAVDARRVGGPVVGGGARGDGVHFFALEDATLLVGDKGARLPGDVDDEAVWVDSSVGEFVPMRKTRQPENDASARRLDGAPRVTKGGVTGGSARAEVASVVDGEPFRIRRGVHVFSGRDDKRRAAARDGGDHVLSLHAAGKNGMQILHLVLHLESVRVNADVNVRLQRRVGECLVRLLRVDVIDCGRRGGTVSPRVIAGDRDGVPPRHDVRRRKVVD